jgi:hypothetical protein
VPRADRHGASPADSHRLFHCAACRRQVRICRPCDRGQIYCPEGDCRLESRRVSVRRAGQRYQRTAIGARGNARRQKRYRAKRSRNTSTVTHQGSPETPPRREESLAAATGATPETSAAASVTASSTTTEKEPTPNDPDARAIRATATTTTAGPTSPLGPPQPPPPPRCDFCHRSCGTLSRRGPLREQRHHRRRFRGVADSLRR